jgi:hypothetical protein
MAGRDAKEPKPRTCAAYDRRLSQGGASLGLWELPNITHRGISQNWGTRQQAMTAIKVPGP